MSTAVAVPTWNDVARWHFPNASCVDADHLLWNHTPFPFGTVEQVEASLRTLRATLDAGLRPCELCNAPATVKRGAGDFCAECVTIFERSEDDEPW